MMIIMATIMGAMVTVVTLVMVISLSHTVVPGTGMEVVPFNWIKL